MEAWWTVQQSGMIGGIGGALIGVLGAALGCSGVLVQRGKCKPLVMGILAFMIVVGLATLCTAFVALAQKQPYHVWYVLLMGGLLSACLPGGLMPVILARYKAAERRRLEAEQLRRT